MNEDKCKWGNSKVSILMDTVVIISLEYVSETPRPVVPTRMSVANNYYINYYTYNYYYNHCSSSIHSASGAGKL